MVRTNIDSTCSIATYGIAQLIKVSYSTIKGLVVGESVTTPTFTIGGHEWCIGCCLEPVGVLDTCEYISLFLELLCKSEEVNAIMTLYLLNKDGRPSLKPLARSPFIFCPGHLRLNLPYFIKRADLETHHSDTNGCFTIACRIKLEGGSCKHLAEKNISQNISRLLDNGDMADVTFEVEGKSFVAHKLILAMVSPVFKAEFFGSMAESRTEMKPIIIKDMHRDVFKYLLQFIYTGSVIGEDSTVMNQHLLVAADRYGIESLKLICEEMLCNGFSLDTVTSTLSLADRHNCNRLKDACLEFIVVPENLRHLEMIKDYIDLIDNFPSLLDEIKAMSSLNSSYIEITQTCSIWDYVIHN